MRACRAFILPLRWPRAENPEVCGTRAGFPVLAALKKDTVAPLTSKAIGVALTANPKDIINTILFGPCVSVAIFEGHSPCLTTFT